MSAITVCGVVVAAGSSTRFGGRREQFELVGGIRMIDRSAASARRVCDHVTVVMPPGHWWDGDSSKTPSSSSSTATELMSLLGDPLHLHVSTPRGLAMADMLTAMADG